MNGAPDVIGFYNEIGVELPNRGGEIPVSCFGHPDTHKNGDRNKSASVNADTGLWFCHTCGAGGNAYQAAIEVGLSKERALELCRKYGLSEENGRGLKRPPLGPISTEHTEHSPESPVGTGDRPFGGGTNTNRTHTEHSKPPKLASEPRILDRFDKKMSELGLIGERHIARATYLVHISRLLRAPARAIVKGDSSTGKSFAVECALQAAGAEFLWTRSATSPLALFYSEESFEHRTLVFYEANKLGDDDDPFARVLRTLISEGKLAYEYTDARLHRTTYLEKRGPVAFLSTIARASLDREIETRILSLHSDGSDAMTANVVRAVLESANDTRPEVDFDEWHALDRWLASMPAEVVVPWGPALARFNLSGPPRLRRDITNLLALVKAHALLHRLSRPLDSRHRIEATLDDYEVVRELLSEALAVATDKAVRSGMREVVEAVDALRKEGKSPVSLRAASRKAGRSSSTTHTDVHDALDRGYLLNRSQRANCYDLDVGDPLPTSGELLPAGGVLAQECSASDRSVFGGGANTASSTTTGDLGERSVCSVDMGPRAAEGTYRPPCSCADGGIGSLAVGVCERCGGRR